jgi:methionyl-tRNA formyltransferase
LEKETIKTKLKTIFMGTPEFSVPCLRKLHEYADVAAVFTQPDRPVGRGYKVRMSPIKQFAIENNIPVYTPQKLREDENIDIIKAINPDVIIVVAYGQILPKSVLEIPRYGCINIHASILPKWRGAAPVQYAIMNGDTVTGVTSMEMDEGMDTGDILLTEEMNIEKSDTSDILLQKLSVLGAELLIKTLENIGKTEHIKQDNSAATYSHLIKKEDSLLDIAKSAKELYDQIRAITAYTYEYNNNKRIKIYASEIVENEADGLFVIKCGDGKFLSILEIQPENGRRMTIKEFLLGHSL